MLRVLCALSLISTAAMAESIQPFSYLQLGQGQSGFSCGWNESTDLEGSTLSASWQFAPEWFASAQQFESDARQERCSDTRLSVEVQTVTAGYVIHSNSDSDWFAKAGWLHREFPGNERFLRATAEYERTLYDRDDAVVSAGARHRFGRYFELTWDAGVITQNDGKPYGAATMRWLTTERFSAGIQYTQFGSFYLFDVSARYRF